MGEVETIILADKFKEGDMVYVISKLNLPVFYIFIGFVWGYHDGWMMQAINVRSRDVCLISPIGVRLWPLTRQVLFEKYRPYKQPKLLVKI